ncbi:hypothetical protein CLOM_g7564 [Closterium sp. NIES-68]|nr:hypothetical protein CLOM_g7564 [Closterium sp. NIES-68]
MFRCHRVIMAARCDYFRVLFNRQAAHSHAHTPPAPQQHAAVVLSGSGAVLPCFQLPDLTAYAFHKILEFIYTDRIQHIAVSQAIDVIDAAARFLLFPSSVPWPMPSFPSSTQPTCPPSATGCWLLTSMACGS